MGDLDKLLKKLVEEAHETTLAAKDIAALDAVAAAKPDAVDEKLRSAEVDHLRYEAGDVVYHLMVLLERCGISLDEFAAEMNSRMTEDEISLRQGVVLLKPDTLIADTTKNRGQQWQNYLELTALEVSPILN